MQPEKSNVLMTHNLSRSYTILELNNVKYFRAVIVLMNVHSNVGTVVKNFLIFKSVINETENKEKGRNFFEAITMRE